MWGARRFRGISGSVVWAQGLGAQDFAGLKSESANGPLVGFRV